jgi:hypothetical protein
VEENTSVVDLECAAKIITRVTLDHFESRSLVLDRVVALTYQFGKYCGPLDRDLSILVNVPFCAFNLRHPH